LIDTFVSGLGAGPGVHDERADLSDLLHTKQQAKTPPPMKAAAELLHAQCVTSSAAGTG
jgi:hypothetical protein